MIDVKGLRVGNIVSCDADEINPQVEQAFVYGLNRDSVLWETEIGGYGKCGLWARTAAERISAIPLTEEWLTKLGFEKVVIGGDETYYSTQISINWKEHSGFLFSNDLFCKIAHLPKSVHSFQNLAYAVIGTELIYTP